jgi:hypothetical protein
MNATLTAARIALAVSLLAPTASAREPAGQSQGVVSDDDVHFQLRTGQATILRFSRTGPKTFRTYRHFDLYDELCSAPCETSLPPGQYRLSLSRGDDSPAKGEDVDVPAGTSTIKGEYVSRAGSRLVGYAMAIGGGAAGAGLLAYGLFGSHQTECAGSSCVDVGTVDAGATIAGGVVTLASVLVGWLVFMRPDEAHFQVLGADARVVPSAWSFKGTEGGSRAAGGLSLSATW